MSKFRKLSILAALAALGAGAALAQQAAPAAKTDAKADVKPAPLGRVALPEEIKAWDIAIRPDGQNLPPGKGSVKQGEKLYGEQCAICHGEFGEGAGNFPVLVGGEGSLTGPAPTKSIAAATPPRVAFTRALPASAAVGSITSLAPASRASPALEASTSATTMVAFG